MSFLNSFFKTLSKRERITFWIAVLLCVVGIAGFAVMFFLTRTDRSPAAGGLYREGMVGQPAHLNPVLAKTPADKSLTALLFANIPDMAEAVETSKDGKTVSVRIKDNLTWSDGQEITSDDIIFTVEAIQDPDSGSTQEPAWQGVVAKRVSKLEVSFSLPNRYVFFNDNLANLRPLPKHLFAEIPTANWKFSEYNLKPVTSGRYVVVMRALAPSGLVRSYRLKANPRFMGEKPYLEFIEFLFARNQEELLTQFNGGQTDGVFFADASDANGILRPYQATEFASPTYYAVFWNQSANAALTFPEVREALRLSIDRTELATAAKARPSTDPLSPAFFPTLNATSSSEEAAALLEKNGWLVGDNGVRTKKERKATNELAFTLTVPDVPFLKETAETLASEWQKIGARVTVSPVSLDNLLAEPVKNRTYEALLFGNTPTRNGDLFSFWHSSERLYPGLNLALYQKKAADKLIEGIRETEDPDKRKADMDTLRQMIAKDDPALFLFAPSSLYATTKRLKGMEGHMLGDSAERFQNFAAWYTETRRVIKK